MFLWTKIIGGALAPLAPPPPPPPSNYGPANRMHASKQHKRTPWCGPHGVDVIMQAYDSLSGQQ